MKSKNHKVSKKDLDRYSEFESFQYMRSENSALGHIFVIKHPIENRCVYMKELSFNDKEEFESQILKYLKSFLVFNIKNQKKIRTK